MGWKNKPEVDYREIGTIPKWIMVFMSGAGSSLIFTPLYLKNTFYDNLAEGLGANNTELGLMVTLFSIMAAILYLPSGIVGDRVRMRTLYSVGMFLSAAVTFWYATMPPIGVVFAIFIIMGITTILIWWGSRYKMLRMCWPEEDYPAKIGWSYTFYGLAGMVIGFVNTGIVASVADDPVRGIQLVLIVSGFVLLALGILALFVIPNFKNELQPGSKLDLSGLVKAIKNPVILVGSLAMFFCWFTYEGFMYTTPYMTSENIYAAPLAVSSTVSIIRNYGIGLFAAAIAGGIAKKITTSKTIIIFSIIAAVGTVFFFFIPRDPSLVIFVAALILITVFFAYGAYSITSATLTEAHIPTEIFATAMGVYCLIGFLPDVFQPTWFGIILDQQGDAAYTMLFAILIVSSVLAVVLLILFRKLVKKQQLKAEAEQPAAVEAEASEQ